MVRPHTAKGQQHNNKKILKWRPTEDRPRRKPKLRWEDQIYEDIRDFNITNWRNSIRNRDEWKRTANRI